ncbi:hypothetical protein ACET3Z_009117 [Daucus carota]
MKKFTSTFKISSNKCARLASISRWDGCYNGEEVSFGSINHMRSIWSLSDQVILSIPINCSMILNIQAGKVIGMAFIKRRNQQSFLRKGPGTTLDAL